MKQGGFLFLLIFQASQLLFAQETVNDTGVNLPSYDSLIKLQIKLHEFDIYRELNYTKMNLGVNEDPNTIWIWTRLSLAGSELPDRYSGESPGSMLEPLHEQFLENSRLNPIRYVLGMAQTAAVGYLAYRHIKKYGLFK